MSVRNALLPCTHTNRIDGQFKQIEKYAFEIWFRSNGWRCPDNFTAAQWDTSTTEVDCCNRPLQDTPIAFFMRGVEKVIRGQSRSNTSSARVYDNSDEQ